MCLSYLKELATRKEKDDQIFPTNLDSDIAVLSYTQKEREQSSSPFSIISKTENKRKSRQKQNSVCKAVSEHHSLQQSSVFSSVDCTIIDNKKTKVSQTLSAVCLSRNIITCSLSVIAKMKRKYSLLDAVRPKNCKAEKERFMRSHFRYNPYFRYSVQANDEMMEKFRTPSDKYISQAVLILRRVTDHFGSYEAFEEINGGRLLSWTQIYNRVERYLESDKLIDEVKINLCDDLLSQGSLTKVQGQTVLNVRCVNLRENWAEGLLRHEIGTHYYRSCNNRCQPWHKKQVRQLLKMGPMNPTEEGLASLHSVLFRSQPFLWRPALLYYTAYMASKMSFKELFHDLRKFVKSPNVRWDYCLRAKRGQELTREPGCFCKDQVYLEGALQLLKRRKDLDFQLLIRLGKVSFKDINRISIRSVANLKYTRIPWFMKDMNSYHRKLEHIVYTNGLTDNLLNLVE